MSEEITWVELPAADTAKARPFYNGLSGWNTSEYGEDYHVVGNGLVGAIAPRDESFTPSAGLSRHRGHRRLGQAPARARRNQWRGPEIPGVGRIAHCHDDQGTPFSLHEPAPQG